MIGFRISQNSTTAIGFAQMGLRSSRTPKCNGDARMSQNSDWSPDEPLGTEAHEQGDEARDEAGRTDVDFAEDVEQDPSIDPARQIDTRELEEAGAEFDDPEELVTLAGGIDDPDGLGEPSASALARREGDRGWDLDAPLVRDDADRGSAD